VRVRASVDTFWAFGADLSAERHSVTYIYTRLKPIRPYKKT